MQRYGGSRPLLALNGNLNTTERLPSLVQFITQSSTEVRLLSTSAQVAAAVMRRMAVLPGKDPGEAARLFAKALHDAWGVGDAACNNGVLLLLSIDDREVGVCRPCSACI